MRRYSKFFDGTRFPTATNFKGPCLTELTVGAWKYWSAMKPLTTNTLPVKRVVFRKSALAKSDKIGALGIVADQLPTETELVELLALLGTQTKQFVGIVVVAKDATQVVEWEGFLEQRLQSIR